VFGCLLQRLEIRGSSVGMTRLPARQSGILDSSVLQTVDRCSGAETCPLFSEHRGSFQRVKRSGREVNHSLLCSAEVKNERSYTYSPTIRLHVVDREDITFIFTDCLPIYFLRRLIVPLSVIFVFSFPLILYYVRNFGNI
jgi:hypothetical protein